MEVGCGGGLGFSAVKMSCKFDNFKISIHFSSNAIAAMRALKFAGSYMRQFDLKHKLTCSFMAQQMLIKTNDSTMKHKLVYLNISVYAQCINTVF